MRKKTVVVLAALGLLGTVALLALKSYQLELIHYIVVNAVIQKSPEDDNPRIRTAFEQAQRRAKAEGKEEAYVKRLLAFSQRLEKVQQLNPVSLNRMLEEVRKFDQPLQDPDAEIR